MVCLLNCQSATTGCWASFYLLRIIVYEGAVFPSLEVEVKMFKTSYKGKQNINNESESDPAHFAEYHGLNHHLPHLKSRLQPLETDKGKGQGIASSTNCRDITWVALMTCHPLKWVLLADTYRHTSIQRNVSWVLSPTLCIFPGTVDTVVSKVCFVELMQCTLLFQRRLISLETCSDQIDHRGFHLEGMTKTTQIFYLRVTSNCLNSSFPTKIFQDWERSISSTSFLPSLLKPSWCHQSYDFKILLICGPPLVKKKRGTQSGTTLPCYYVLAEGD